MRERVNPVLNSRYPKILQNKPSVAKVGFDTAENGPSEVRVTNFLLPTPIPCVNQTALGLRHRSQWTRTLWTLVLPVLVQPSVGAGRTGLPYLMPQGSWEQNAFEANPETFQRSSKLVFMASSECRQNHF